jgi:hypothetical protein
MWVMVGLGRWGLGTRMLAGVDKLTVCCHTPPHKLT